MHKLGSILRREAMVWWLGQKTRIQEVVGSNTGVYLMDVSNASYYTYIEKQKNKCSRMGNTKKVLFK
jgi:hypothetical protein